MRPDRLVLSAASEDGGSVFYLVECGEHSPAPSQGGLGVYSGANMGHDAPESQQQPLGSMDFDVAVAQLGCMSQVDLVYVAILASVGFRNLISLIFYRRMVSSRLIWTRVEPMELGSRVGRKCKDLDSIAV